MQESDDLFYQAPEVAAPAKPESWDALISEMSQQVYENLKTAVELGKWPNGDRLSPAQLEYSLQAVIAYDALHFAETERVGYIDRSKQKKTLCDD